MRETGITLFVLFFSILVLVSCRDEYLDKGIEGRWQLREIINEDGSVSEVDTIFYSFKKSVFEYLKLRDPYNYFHCFGNYKIEDKTLKINVSHDSFEPEGYDQYFDWNSYDRNFQIKEHTSSRLQLEYEGIILKFRRY